MSLAIKPLFRKHLSSSLSSSCFHHLITHLTKIPPSHTQGAQPPYWSFSSIKLHNRNLSGTLGGEILPRSAFVSVASFWQVVPHKSHLFKLHSSLASLTIHKHKKFFEIRGFFDLFAHHYR